MNPNSSDPPALGHSSNNRQTPHEEQSQFLQVPTSTGWWSILAGAGMPRRGSIGFSENYLSDAAPPFCLDEDSNSSSPVRNSILPSETYIATSPPIRKRTTLVPPGGTLQDIPSPSENFLYSYFSKQIGAPPPQASSDLSSSNISVIVSPCEEEDDPMEPLSVIVPQLHGGQRNFQTITSNLQDCITMEDFPVATEESLAELANLKRQILASDFEEKSLQLSRSDLKELEHSPNVETYNERPNEVNPNPKSDQGKDHGSDQPNKLMSYIFSQPFAQNWFFKNPNYVEGSEASAPGPSPMERARRLKEMNVWAPQNL